MTPTAAHPTAERIQGAMNRAQLSQRELAAATELSQATLSRILSGKRDAKLPELVLIADATGTTLTRLTGAGAETRHERLARDGGDSQLEARLIDFLDLWAYLDDQAIPGPS